MTTKQYSHHSTRWCSKGPRNAFNRLTVRWNCSRIPRYIIFVAFILFILNGQPKFLFPSHLHLPWLTSVKHVQPLQCLLEADQPEWPRAVPLYGDKYTKPTDHLTVAIVTARPEFKRLPATLAALVCHLDVRRIAEVVFLVPPQDVALLEPYLSIEQAKYWPWPVSIISDDILLEHVHTNSYRLQMMFKLVLGQIIKTEYYLILDSDCLALWPIHVEQLLHPNQDRSSYRAVYQIEGKSGHETWWSESEQLLQIKLEACTTNGSSATMGVTPTILSRTISLRTLCRLQKLYGDDYFLNKMANWALWRLLVGRMWTEYTLYYLTARCTQIFDRYYLHHNDRSSSNSFPKLNLYGLSIWSLDDWTSQNQIRLVDFINTGLKWRRKEKEEAGGQALIDNSTDIHSLFSVLQGRHNVNPKLYHQLFYPLYIAYLQQQNQTTNLVTILNSMCEKLVTD